MAKTEYELTPLVNDLLLKWQDYGFIVKTEKEKEILVREEESIKDIRGRLNRIIYTVTELYNYYEFLRRAFLGYSTRLRRQRRFRRAREYYRASEFVARQRIEVIEVYLSILSGIKETYIGKLTNKEMLALREEILGAMGFIERSSRGVIGSVRKLPIVKDTSEWLSRLTSFREDLSRHIGALDLDKILTIMTIETIEIVELEFSTYTRGVYTNKKTGKITREVDLHGSKIVKIGIIKPMLAPETFWSDLYNELKKDIEEEFSERLKEEHEFPIEQQERFDEYPFPINTLRGDFPEDWKELSNKARIGVKKK